jgi:D-alanine-D-alanine ligase
MTRIGFAYNQKPEPVVALRSSTSGTSRSGENSSHQPLDSSAPGGFVTPEADDEFAEWDSAETIAAVERALAAFGEVIRLEADEDFPERLRDASPDIVFNIAEGRHGPNREAHVPAICEFYGIPYTGSDPFTLSLCLDKARTKEVLSARGVRTPAYFVAASVSDVAANAGRLAFPVFAKPIHEGSSKGVFASNFCRDAGELEERVGLLLERYEQPVLVEEFLTGAEFTCGVLGNGAEARVLPIVAIRFDTLPEGAVPVYGYEAKWVWDTPDNPLEIFECPAAISDDLREKIESVTLAAYHAVGCRDWTRLDVRLDAAGEPHVLEINPLPGILPDPKENSCLPKAARAAGIGYDELIQACLIAGARRQGVRLPRRARGRRPAAA